MQMTVTRPRHRRDRSHMAPVTSREELIYLLTRASELEHGLACVYLFAAYSLKNDVSEGGLTPAQAEMVRRWKRSLSSVAVEEMLHLAQVSNMLTAIGGAPHFKRANLPMPANAFPFGIRLSLEPFSQETIERLVCYEMPEGGVLTAEQEQVYSAMRARIIEAEGGGSVDFTAGGAPVRLGTGRRAALTEPFEIDFRTVGEFYHKIETGFLDIPEHELFIGPRDAQASARYLDLSGELVTVVDRTSACSAIDRASRCSPTVSPRTWRRRRCRTADPSPSAARRPLPPAPRSTSTATRLSRWTSGPARTRSCGSRWISR